MGKYFAAGMFAAGVAVAAACGTLTASAEGYQVNSFSARQTGMGHTGVALKLGAESQLFNPGAMAFTDKKLDVSAGMSAIKASAYCTHDGREWETSNKISTPFNFAASFRIWDELYAGIALYTPYGSSINWGKGWPGATLSQSVSLQVFTVQPTIAWHCSDKFSIGAGLMISWGSVDLSKGLVTWDTASKLGDIAWQAAALKHQLDPSSPSPGERPAEPSDKNIPPASVNLKGTSDLALGFSVGLMYNIDKRWTLGASLRSEMSMRVKKGDASVTYDAAPLIENVLRQNLDEMNSTNFSASMPCPYVFTVGGAYRPADNVEIALDVQLNGWASYDYLDIKFAGLPKFDQKIKKDYRDAMTFHLGAQCGVTKRLDLRAGMMIDLSPCNTDYYNPETPAMTKIEPTIGLTFRPTKRLAIDLAFMYIKGMGVQNAVGQTDQKSFAQGYSAAVDQYNATVAALNAMGMQIPSYPKAEIPATAEFRADYAVHAIVPAIGLSYSF